MSFISVHALLGILLSMPSPAAAVGVVVVVGVVVDVGVVVVVGVVFVVGVVVVVGAVETASLGTHLHVLHAAGFQ